MLELDKKLVIILFLTFFSFSEGKGKQPVAPNAEINEYLFGDPEATYLDDFKNGIYQVPLRGSQTDFDTKKDVKFTFKTKKSEKTFTIDNQTAIESSDIDASMPVKVVIHGWKNSANSPMITSITNSYLKHHNVTIIVVDWSKLANTGYLTARELIEDVASAAGDFLKYLIDKNLTKLENVHLIGHSLGAHTAGLLGKDIKSKGLGKVPVIFGLDPAGPLFGKDEPGRRIDKDDADLVVVLHTSTILGFTEPLGHVDFYPNFGFSQPGCGVDLLRQCAHSRAYEYFSEAIETFNEEDEFWAVKCRSDYDEIEAENCDKQEIEDKFGEALIEKKNQINGLYYFTTNSAKPWSKGKDGTQVLDPEPEYTSSNSIVLDISSLATLIILFTSFNYFY